MLISLIILTYERILNKPYYKLQSMATYSNPLIKEITIPTLLSPASIADLTNQLTVLEKENVRFIVLKGSDHIFCNGLDLRWVAHNESGNYMPEMQEYGEFLKKLQTGKAITIAIVKGKAAGGGMGVVCSCDYVIANTDSEFSLPEGLLGLIPGMIMPSLLNRLSPQQIKKMVLTGKGYTAEIAMEWGIADDVVINENIEPTLNQVVSSMKSCKQGSVADIKQMLYTSQINKDDLAQLGMTILSAKLNEPDIKERLQDLANYMED